MLSDLRAVEAILLRARCPEDIFGTLGGMGVPVATRLVALKKAYHHAVLVVHPDKYAGAGAVEESLLATELFGKLTEWKSVAEAKIASGSYGDEKPHVPAPPAVKAVAQVIQTPKRKYVVSDLIAEGDLADVYFCSYVEGAAEHKAAFKIAQSAGDNDLLENEARVLGAMYPKKQAEERFYRYLSKPLDSFLLRAGREAARRVSVMQLAEGFVSLSAILTAYPKGVDYRDAVWMFKRALAGLWYVHRQKLVVHGAVLPPHLLFHPTGHGAKIVDWCYAVSDWPEKKTHVRAISKAYRAYYPPEILAKKPPSPQSDLFMLGKCMVALLGGDVATGRVPDAVPKAIRSFLASLLIEKQSMRPEDAGKLHEEFDALLLSVIGKPKYRPLEMPASKM